MNHGVGDDDDKDMLWLVSSERIAESRDMATAGRF